MDIPVPYSPGLSALVNGSGPYPDHQGMSPTPTAAFDERQAEMLGSVQGSRVLGSQLPVGYGATAESNLVNGTAAAPSFGTALSSGTAPVVSSGLGASEATDTAAARETGPVVTRVQGSVGQPYTYTPASTTPPVAPAAASHTQQQLPYVSSQSRAQRPPEPHASVAGENGRVDSAGTRLSLEAQRAMSQLSSQRTALVHALQQRAARASSAFATLEGDGDDSATMRPGSTTQSEDQGEEVVWYSRLQGFLRRRVVEPVREQVEHLRRSPLNPSPQSAWQSASPAPSEPLMDAQTRRAMREWTEQGTSLLPAPSHSAQVDGITEEDVLAEVRRQVAAALENRDQQVRSLQVENGELRQLLKAVMESSDMLERVVDTEQRAGQEDHPRPRALEGTGNPGGARHDAVSQQGDLPRVPALAIL